jgi:cysteinyl-tRNA synthetase
MSFPTRPLSEPVTDKWDLWSQGTRLRGADLHPCKQFTVDNCLEAIGRQDVQDLRDLNANLINASYPGIFSVRAPYQVDEKALTDLDNLVEWAEEAGIYVVIHYRTGPGRSEGDIVQEGEQIDDVWRDEAARQGWVDMWQFTAERYKDSPVVAGYNLMVEPHPNTLIDPDSEMDPQEVQTEMDGTTHDWNSLAAEITAAIRQVDPETPIIINSLNWASAEWFPALQATGDARTVYSLHAYDPDLYTNQEEGEEDIRYPDEVEDSGERILFDQSWLEGNYQPVREFAAENLSPIYVGEFGALRTVPDAPAFLEDQINLFEEYGWNHAVYVWRGDEPEFDGFNLEMGPDPGNHRPDHDNTLLNVFRESWQQNTTFPNIDGNVGATSKKLPAIANVEHWLYLLDVDLTTATIDQIVASNHDLVVLDFIPSEENNTDFPMAEVIEGMHNAQRPKLVLAYIDIGEAESYRTYWQPGWRVGDPEWIAGEDPDGWEENYPVAYWNDQWRDIWLGSGGIMQGILDAGFDGVYLDWVEAYSDESVLEIAGRDGVDARQEMIWWVGDIADFGRNQEPGFIVIGQNAAELAEDNDYVAIIDAIAQEQVWFDGGADNDPPGDCPLPQTENDIDSDSYANSLSPDCRRQYEDYPDSTLHVSSQEYLEYLFLAQEKGLPIFTVDYALEPQNISWVYETSRSLGFVPFVSSRALDGFVEPFGD